MEIILEILDIEPDYELNSLKIFPSFLKLTQFYLFKM